MRKFINKYILEIIMVILLVLIVIVTISVSEKQKVSYTQSYYKPMIEVVSSIGEATITTSAPKVKPKIETLPTTLMESLILTIAPEPKLSPTSKPTSTPKASTDINIYNIKLSENLQQYTYETCKKYGIDYELVLAIMYVESSYDPKTVGSSGELSLMQIHPINFEWLQNDLGVLDFYNPEHNILAGIYMLADLQKSFDSTSHVLVAYNVGKYGSKQLFKKGVNETKYSVKVEAVRDELISHGAIINY